MLNLEQALEQLLKTIPPAAGSERVDLIWSIGRFLAEPAVAAHPLPLFDNSAMDGWAVRSADVASASPENPVSLKSIAHIPAGQFFAGEIASGQCARIFTGSPLPRSVDAVVMQEDSRPGAANAVLVLDSVKPWENIRFRGEDVKEGAVLGRTGERINPQLASLLSACGVPQVNVHRTLRVAVLATGNELREPDQFLSPGEIHESNRILIGPMLAQLGIDPIIFPIVADEFDATVTAIEKALEFDAVITCGGVSVGEHDYVKAAIGKLGGAINFWRIAIKPGKPFMHATLRGKPIFGLPGNPVSAQVTFLLLARPALLKMSGANNLAAPASFGELAETISNRGDRRHFIRVLIDAEGRVRTSGPQASHRLASLAAANGLLDVPPETTWESGRKVKVLRLDF